MFEVSCKSITSHSWQCKILKSVRVLVSNIGFWLMSPSVPS